MMNILKKRWQRLAWFMASLLTAVLISFSSNQAPTTAAVSPNTVAQFSSSGVAFDRFAASHLEPNFYQ